MEEKVLLVGNGINRGVDDFSWETLLNELSRGLDIKSKDKPLPLLYEEIVIKLNKMGKTKNPKDIVANTVKKLKPREVHKRILKMEFQNILTTNYDFTIEEAFSKNDRRTIYNKEREYNFYRRYKSKRSNVWHIHGEVDCPNSIVLGYDDYLKSIAKMRDYFCDKQGVSSNIMDKKGSWMDFIYEKDIYILGLSLDFVEYDLWWILTKRAKGEELIRGGKIISPKNRIIFFCSEEERYGLFSKCENSNEKTCRYLTDIGNNKFELLQSMGIEIICIDNKINNEINWDYYYEKALDFMENDLGNKRKYKFPREIEKINYEFIYKKLREYRLKKAISERVRPDLIYSNEILREIIRINPKQVSDLMKVRGIGKKKLEKYGEDILKIVNRK